MVFETAGSYQNCPARRASRTNTDYVTNPATTSGNTMDIRVRKGQGDVKLTREEFERRLRERFFDPEFETVDREIAAIVDVAWHAYDEYRKSPRKRQAGPGF